jgi:hypothetical protein
MKIKIISDGTPVGTQVINEATGETIDQCTSVKFEVSVGKLATVELKLVKVPIQVIGKLARLRKSRKTKAK